AAAPAHSGGSPARPLRARWRRRRRAPAGQSGLPDWCWCPAYYRLCQLAHWARAGAYQRRARGRAAPVLLAQRRADTTATAATFSSRKVSLVKLA
nr:hypothetical protein [Tanacetum cinerariifolium]